MSITLKYKKGAKKRVLVEFTNGIPNESCEFRAEIFQDERQTNPKFRDRKILVVHGQHLTYIGNNYEYKEKYPFNPDLMVTELNKLTNVMQIFDVDIFKMSPILASDIAKIDENDDKERLKVKKQLEEDNRSFSNKQDDLTEVFGSHKRKRAMNTRHRNKVDEDSTAAIQKAIETILDEDTSVLVTDGAATDTTNILPYNKEAERSEDVYPLLSIIPENILNALETEATKFIKPSHETIAEWKKMNNELSSEYIRSHAQYPLISVVQDKAVYVRYACCLQLFAYFVKLYKFKYADLRSKTCLEETNELIRFWMFEEFMVGDAKNKKMPPRMKDKVLANAIALAWHIDSFSIKEENFISALAISSRKFSRHVSALGGQFKTVGGSRCAVLSLPLKFPTSGQRARKR